MECPNEEKKNENPGEQPKAINKFIDLHFHLDGSIVLPIAKKLGEIQKIPLPGNNDEELEKHLSVESTENLVEFLNCF